METILIQITFSIQYISKPHDPELLHRTRHHSLSLLVLVVIRLLCGARKIAVINSQKKQEIKEITGTDYAVCQYVYHISWHCDCVSQKRSTKSKY